MKRVTLFALAFIMAWSMLSVSMLSAEEAGTNGQPFGYGVNLLKNGDFELGDASSWFVFPDDQPEWLATVSSSVYSDTNQFAFKISSPGLDAQFAITGIDQTIAVKPDEWLRLNANLFIEQMENALVTFKINYFDQNGSELPKRSVELNTFRELDNSNIGVPLAKELITLTPPEARFAKVNVHLKAREAGGKGTIYVDNIRLVHEWAPRHLSLSSSTDTSLELSWTPPAGETPLNYRIYRNDETTPIGTTDGTVTSFTASGLGPATAYRFTVRAESESGFVSIVSNEIRVATAKTPGTVTIMPLGASITYGKYHAGGYRGFLWKQLRQAGFQVNFVGSQSENSFGVIDGLEPDNDHEGHPGFTADQIADLVDSEVVLHKPDIVLVFAGTNDMFDPGQAETAHTDIDTLLTKITTLLPETYIIVSSIAPIFIPTEEEIYTPRILAYNQKIREIAASYQSAGKRVGFVDNFALMKEEYFPYDPINDFMKDGIHPTRAAFEVMGEVWFDAVQAILAHGDIASKDPSRPDGLEYSYNSDGSVKLEWLPSTDNRRIDHYEILDGEGHFIDTTTETNYSTALLAGTSYTFKIAAVDPSANRSPESEISFTTLSDMDTVPPNSPAEIRSTGVFPDEITVEWDAVSDDDLYRYEVFVGDESIGETSETSFTISHLNALTEYSITVGTIDRSKNKSVTELNPDVIVKTLPAAPSGFTITGQTSSSVSLSWEPAPGSGIVGYVLTMDDQEFLLNTNSYTASGLAADRTYKFKIHAVDEAQRRSPASDELSVTIAKPNPPENLRVEDITDRSFVVKWNEVPGVAKYEIHINDRKMNQGDITTPSYAVTDLQPFTTYTIKLRSVDTAGNMSDFAVMSNSVTTKKTEPEPTPAPGQWPGPGQGPIPGTGSAAGTPPISGSVPPQMDAVQYEEIKGAIKLKLEPNEHRLKDAANSSEPFVEIVIPSELPYHSLELNISGEVLNLFTEKQKKVIIRAKGWTLKLPPGWHPASKGQQWSLRVDSANNSTNAAEAQQLTKLTGPYSFNWMLDGKPVSDFLLPIQLTLTSSNKPNPGTTGVYEWNDLEKSWGYVGGSINQTGEITAWLPHFSVYGAFESRKTFTDIAGHWAREDIESLTAKQIVSGMTDVMFEPHTEVTRAQFAALLNRALKLPASEHALPFRDVPVHAWYYHDVQADYQAGVIQGLNSVEFAPDESINREQMAVMIINAYLHTTGRDIEQFEKTEETEAAAYKDNVTISAWAKTHIRIATELGLVFGDNGNYRPHQSADRAQAAAIVNRLVKLLN